MKLEATKTSWFSEEGFVAATSQKKEMWGRSMSLRFGSAFLYERAIASPVFAVAGLSETAREFSQKSARVAAEFFCVRRESEPNQRLEPTRLAGAVIATRLLRSTTRRISKFRLCARQRVAHH